MIVLVINQDGILSFKRKSETPIAIDRYCPMISKFSCQPVKLPPGSIHVVWAGGGIKTGQLEP